MQVLRQQSVYLRMHAHVWLICPRMCKTNLKLMGTMWKKRGNAASQWDSVLRGGTHPLVSSLPIIPSISLSPACDWAEWKAILILIPLSLPLPERGKWSPGLWNAPPLCFFFLVESKVFKRQRRLEWERGEESE